MAIFLAEEAHTNKLTVSDVVSTIVTPSTAPCTLSGLLMPQVVEGFDGIMSDS